MCCKIFVVPELDKPAGQWCRHFAKGAGCTIHTTRPNLCRVYQCTWSVVDFLDLAWRPDNAKFVMNSYENELLIETDPAVPDAWRKEPYYAQIKAWSAREVRPFRLVIVRSRARITVVFPEDDIDLGPAQADKQIESGYETRDGKRVPYAYYKTPTRPLVQR